MDQGIHPVVSTQATMGIDLGDQENHYCVVDEAGQVMEEGHVAATPRGLEKLLTGRKLALVAIEAGAQSAWVSRLVAKCGHPVIVANPRKLRLIYENDRKSDRVDAEYLARVARLDPKLLAPIQHRGPAAQIDLALLRSREVLVRARTKMINHVRGVVKSVGGRLPACSTPAFCKRAAEHIPLELGAALHPVLQHIDSLSQQIRGFDRKIEEVARTKYSSTAKIQSVPGVGWLTALAYVLVIEDPKRFPQCRSVAAYLGLVPRQGDSGASSPQLRITKAGDDMLRRLLVGSAQYLLGRFGPDCDLRRLGLALAARGGRKAKKRAVVAVARKLSVILLRLWATGQEFKLFRSHGDSPAKGTVMSLAGGVPPAKVARSPKQERANSSKAKARKDGDASVSKDASRSVGSSATGALATVEKHV